MRNILFLMLAAMTITVGILADSGFMYGTVTTHDDKKYTGYIRWGGEETFWFDEFNAVKLENPFLKHLSKKDKRLLRDSRGDDDVTFSIFDIHIKSFNKSSYTHQFVCRFGDIKRIEGEDEIIVTLKNGEELEVGDNSNDIGAKLTIQDEKIGKINVRWERVESVEFSAPPADTFKERPLYGTVTSEDGSFTGFIQWDSQERLASDELDGDTEDGQVSLIMGEIRTMEKKRNGLLVKTTDKQEYYMTGTTDVGSENRGICITTPDGVITEVSWDSFKKVEFSDKVPAMIGYKDYPNTKRLKAVVTTQEGEKVEGLIAYDLDESWDFESLEGKIDGEEVEHRVPFRLISSIQLNDDGEATVTLKNEKKIEFTDGQDVTDMNQGLLVFKNDTDKKPRYIPWDEIKSVTF